MSNPRARINQLSQSLKNTTSQMTTDQIHLIQETTNAKLIFSENIALVQTLVKEQTSHLKQIQQYNDDYENLDPNNIDQAKVSHFISAGNELMRKSKEIEIKIQLLKQANKLSIPSDKALLQKKNTLSDQVSMLDSKENLAAIKEIISWIETQSSLPGQSAVSLQDMMESKSVPLVVTGALAKESESVNLDTIVTSIASIKKIQVELSKSVSDLSSQLSDEKVQELLKTLDSCLETMKASNDIISTCVQNSSLVFKMLSQQVSPCAQSSNPNTFYYQNKDADSTSPQKTPVDEAKKGCCNIQ